MRISTREPMEWTDDVNEWREPSPEANGVN